LLPYFSTKGSSHESSCDWLARRKATVIKATFPRAASGRDTGVFSSESSFTSGNFFLHLDFVFLSLDFVPGGHV
jgi:hypothetical protein